MTSISVAERQVDAPAEAVYRAWKDPAVALTLMEAITAVRPIDEFRAQWTTQLDRPRHTFFVDLVEDEPGERLSWQSTDGVLHHTDVEFSEEGSQTRVRLRYAWEFESPYGVDESGVSVDPDLAARDLSRLAGVFASV